MPRGRKKKGLACKPASVEYGYLTEARGYPRTHARYPGFMAGRAAPLGINANQPLFALAPGRQSPCRACYQPRGGLLPHRFTLTSNSNAGGLFSVACLWGLPRWVLPTSLPCGGRTFLRDKSPQPYNQPLHRLYPVAAAFHQQLQKKLPHSPEGGKRKNALYSWKDAPLNV